MLGEHMMNERQLKTSREAFKEAIAVAGNQAKMANIAGISQGHVSLTVRGLAVINAVSAVKVMAGTGIPKWRLRPDLFDRPRAPRKIDASARHV